MWGVSPRTRPTQRLTSRVLAHPAAKWARRGALSLVGVSFAFSLVVMPVNDYFSQRSDIARKKREFEALADANEQLYNEVNRLERPEGALAAARRQLGYVAPGEQRIALVPMPALPTDLPPSWPYTMVTDIIRVRTLQADKPSAALAPLTP